MRQLHALSKQHNELMQAAHREQFQQIALEKQRLEDEKRRAAVDIAKMGSGATQHLWSYEALLSQVPPASNNTWKDGAVQLRDAMETFQREIESERMKSEKKKRHHRHRHRSTNQTGVFFDRPQDGGPDAMQGRQ